MWQWQFQVADAKGTPQPYCLRAINLSHGYFLPDELDFCWAVNFIQADCSKNLDFSPETLAAMGNVGNMGTEQAIRVFSACSSLLNDFVQKSQAQGLVFNGEPHREKLYNLFSSMIKRHLKWQLVNTKGSFMTPQLFYFFAADSTTMKNMLRAFKSVGQIDE